MGAVYASVSDIALLSSRTLTTQEQEQAESLLAAASAKLRLQAQRYGKDLDQMIAGSDDLALAVKDTVVNCVMRALESYASSTQAATQTSQSALGYSVSMTYLNAGQSLYYLRNELKDLGILRQQYGGMEVYDIAEHDQGN